MMHLFHGGCYRSLMSLPPSSSSSPALFNRLTNGSIGSLPLARRWWFNRIHCFSTQKHKNFYEALGVPPSASQTDIKKAYYTLSKKYHPDVTGSNGSCAQKYIEIKEAYEVLRDEKQREEHDRWLAAEEIQRQRTVVDGPIPFGRRRQKVHNDWWPNNGSFSEDELRRVWRSMNGNGEFRKAHWEFEAAVRRRRQTAYEEQMKRRNERGKDGFSFNDGERDWTEQNQYQFISKIFIGYLLIVFFLEFLRFFQRPLIPPPYYDRDEEIKRWIEERKRKMP